MQILVCGALVAAEGKNLVISGDWWTNMENLSASHYWEMALGALLVMIFLVSSAQFANNNSLWTIATRKFSLEIAWETRVWLLEVTSFLVCGVNCLLKVRML
jgi:hypothetical protein